MNKAYKEDSLVPSLLILILLCFVFFLINQETNKYFNYSSSSEGAPALYIKVYQTTSLVLSTLLPLLLAMFYTITTYLMTITINYDVSIRNLFRIILTSFSPVLIVSTLLYLLLAQNFSISNINKDVMKTEIFNKFTLNDFNIVSNFAWVAFYVLFIYLLSRQNSSNFFKTLACALTPTIIYWIIIAAI